MENKDQLNQIPEESKNESQDEKTSKTENQKVEASQEAETGAPEPEAASQEVSTGEDFKTDEEKQAIAEPKEEEGTVAESAEESPAEESPEVEEVAASAENREESEEPEPAETEEPQEENPAAEEQTQEEASKEEKVPAASSDETSGEGDSNEEDEDEDDDEHAGDDLVAVGNADHAVELMAVDHRFDRIGDDFAAGKRILHAVVPHRHPVANADRVEDERHTAGVVNRLLDQLPYPVEVHVSRYDIDMAVDDRDKRPLKIVFAHAACPEQTSMRSSGIALFNDIGSHSIPSFL